MKRELIIFIILVIVAIMFLGLFVLGNFLNNKFFNEKNSTKQDSEDKNQEFIKEIEQACVDLGCEKGSMYIGSINSDKYYECTCHYADRIHPENIICFKTKAEAESNDRVFSEC